MNALFLSSLGCTALEAGLFAAVSIAADIAKAVLPVLIVRAMLLRAWLHGAGAALLLTIVLVLSLASGTGFAALTRGTTTAAREAEAGRLAGQQQELRDIEMRVQALAPARPSPVISAERDGVHVDRRWSLSKHCTDPTSPSMRQYCSDVFRLRAEMALASEREKLTGHAQTLRVSIDGLRSSGAGIDSDPQVAAIADLLGADRHRLRLILTTTIAIVLELGAVITVLLLAGPTLGGWRAVPCH